MARATRKPSLPSWEPLWPPTVHRGAELGHKWRSCVRAWRAYSRATAKIADLVGSQPVTGVTAEPSQAVATRVVHSYIPSAATGYDSETYEHVQYFKDTAALSRIHLCSCPQASA